MKRDSETTMLKIGDFAKVSRVSVKGLRYYDEIGLLKPAQIDRYTGYRYYTMAQLPRLHRILALKDLGLSLEQIARLLNQDLPADQIRGMLLLKRAELEELVAAAQRQLAQVEARLRQIEQENTMPDYEVVLKKVAPIRVAGVRDVISDESQVNATFNRLFDEVETYITQHGGKITGPGIALWHDRPDQNPTVAAAFPTGSALPDGDRVHAHELPGVETMACVVHHGGFDSLGPAYNALIGWIQANGYRYDGPSREVYLQYARNGDPAAYVTEIQVPVAKA